MPGISFRKDINKKRKQQSAQSEKTSKIFIPFAFLSWAITYAPIVVSKVPAPKPSKNPMMTKKMNISKGTRLKALRE